VIISFISFEEVPRSHRNREAKGSARDRAAVRVTTGTTRAAA
jgi:hypothetical protein